MADFNADFYSGGAELLLVQSPANANYYGSAQFTVAANVRYYQRVYSSGLSAWCYYDTLNAVEPSPSPNSTNPPWTGSISDHQILAKVPVP